MKKSLASFTMTESRDRLERPVDPSAIFSLRRSGALGVLVDEREGRPHYFGSPPPRRTPVAAAFNRGTARMGSGLGLNGRENASGRRARGRGRSRILPPWYPRTPLQDITHVVRAIERRTARLGEAEGEQFETPVPNRRSRINNQSSAHLKHDASSASPSSSAGTRLVGKVPTILLSVAKEAAGGEPEYLTPERKLLNSIDTVGKVVEEELHKLKRTPSAKKADREKRVRTLMSMR